MPNIIALNYNLAIQENTKAIPGLQDSTLSNAISILEKADYETRIIKAQDLQINYDILKLGNGESVKMSSPFLDQVMNKTSLGLTQMEKMGEDKFIENTNLILQGEGRKDYIIRVINGTAYSITPRDKSYYNSVDHKEFLKGVAEITQGEFNEDELWRISLSGHHMKLVLTHPTRHLDCGAGDISREGLEFRNNDASAKMSFHYHLLRTACLNSTVFPKYLSKASASNQGGASFDRFLKSSLRMFQEGKDYLVPAYGRMKSASLSESTFDWVYKKLSRGMSKEDAPKVLRNYLVPDFYAKSHVPSAELIKSKKEYDLFNDLTHYSKKCKMSTQQRSQELAGEMLIEIMKKLKDRRFRASGKDD